MVRDDTTEREQPGPLRADDPRVLAYVQAGFYSKTLVVRLLTLGLLLFFAVVAGVAAGMMPHRMGAIPIGVYGIFMWVMALGLLRIPTVADAEGVKAPLGRKHLWRDCLGARVKSKVVRSLVGTRKRGGTSRNVYRSDLVYWVELDFKGARGLERGGPEEWCKALVDYATVASAPARPGGVQEALASPAIVQRIVSGPAVGGTRPWLGGVLPGLLLLGLGTLVVLGATVQYGDRHQWFQRGGPAASTSAQGLPSGPSVPHTAPVAAPATPPPGLANLTRATIGRAMVPLQYYVAHEETHGDVFRTELRISGSAGTHHIMLFVPPPTHIRLISEERVISLTRPTPDWDGEPLLAALSAGPLNSARDLERAVRHAGLRVERAATRTVAPETGLVTYAASASQDGVRSQVHIRIFDWSVSAQEHGTQARFDADRAVVVVPMTRPGNAAGILQALTGAP